MYRAVECDGGGVVTTRDKIRSLVYSRPEFTADQAAEYTGRSKTMCKLIINEMVELGELKYRTERIGMSGRVNVYSKDQVPLCVDLGGLRGMMITKAWVPGELRL